MKARQLPPFRVKSLSVTSVANKVFRLEMQPHDCYQPDTFSVWNTGVCMVRPSFTVTSVIQSPHNKGHFTTVPDRHKTMYIIILFLNH